jgi:hypothetical protein
MMKNKILKIATTTFLALFLVSLQGQSQPSLQWGGLGYGFAGLAFHNFSSLSQNLQNTSLIDSPLGTAAPQLGGGGFALIQDRYVVMGQGYGSFLGRERSEAVAIGRTLGGGGLNFGYVLYNEGGILVFPSLGLGGTGTNMWIENQNDNESIRFGDELIRAGERESFTVGAAHLDLSASAFYLLDQSEGNEGFSGYGIGVQVGYQTGLSQNKWLNAGADTEINGVSPESINTFYIRVMIGGGGTFR